jgi:hypothetical protein
MMNRPGEMRIPELTIQKFLEDTHEMIEENMMRYNSPISRSDVEYALGTERNDIIEKDKVS